MEIKQINEALNVLVGTEFRGFYIDSDVCRIVRKSFKENGIKADIVTEKTSPSQVSVYVIDNEYNRSLLFRVQVSKKKEDFKGYRYSTVYNWTYSKAEVIPQSCPANKTIEELVKKACDSLTARRHAKDDKYVKVAEAVHTLMTSMNITYYEALDLMRFASDHSYTLEEKYNELYKAN